MKYYFNLLSLFKHTNQISYDNRKGSTSESGYHQATLL